MKGMSEHCIYTIASGARLAAEARKRRPASFTEKKMWATGYRLWQEAEAAGRAMPVLLADAADCSRILYWGLLTGIKTGERSTTYSIDCVRPLPGRHVPQELILRSSQRQIAPHFIRPYAICCTPIFLHQPSRTTRSTEPPPATSVPGARSRSDARDARGTSPRRRSVRR